MNGSNHNTHDLVYDMNEYEANFNNAYDRNARELIHAQGENFANYENYAQSIDHFGERYNTANEEQQLHYQENIADFQHGGPDFQHGGPDFQHVGPDFQHVGPDFQPGGPDFQHSGYQDYHLTEVDAFHQNISPGEFTALSQNISPASFSSDGRQFYQEQMTGTPPQVTNSNSDAILGHLNHQNIQQIESPFPNQPSPKKVGNIPGDTLSNSVNGILEMEGSVEPNGPILGGHGYIPAQTMQKAYFELGETPEIKAACLRGFRQQIDIHQEENNFDEHSDAFLLKFLRSRKFDVEAAYSLLERYYNVRENKPEVFRNLTRKNVKRTMEQGIVGVLPQRDKKGRVLMSFNYSKWNMSLPFHFEKLLRVFVYTLEKLFESEETQINGVVIICNLAQLGVLQTKSLGAPMIDKVLEIFEGNFPFRLNAIHLLNPPWHFKLLWKMVDPLKKIKQKTARKIFIHDGDLSRFQSEFDQDILPKELGGKCPPYDNSLWVKEILEPEQSQQTQNQKLQGLHPPSTPNLRRSPTQSRKGVKSNIKFE